MSHLLFHLLHDAINYFLYNFLPINYSQLSQQTTSQLCMYHLMLAENSPYCCFAGWLFPKKFRRNNFIQFVRSVFPEFAVCGARVERAVCGRLIY